MDLQGSVPALCWLSLLRHCEDQRVKRIYISVGQFIMCAGPVFLNSNVNWYFLVYTGWSWEDEYRIVEALVRREAPIPSPI
jgi:uncharacterized membrane protein